MGLPRVDEELARFDAESESRRDSDFECETLNLELKTSGWGVIIAIRNRASEQSVERKEGARD